MSEVNSEVTFSVTLIKLTHDDDHHMMIVIMLMIIMIADGL